MPKWQFEIESKGLGSYYYYRVFHPLAPNSEIRGRSLKNKKDLESSLRKTVKRLNSGEGHQRKLIHSKGD